MWTSYSMTNNFPPRAYKRYQLHLTECLPAKSGKVEGLRPEEQKDQHGGLEETIFS